MIIIPKSLPRHIRYLLIVYLQGMVLFTALRLVLLLTQFHDFSHIPDKISIALHAFWNGFRFDTLISCYILFIPMILLMIASFRGRVSRKLYRGISIFILVCYSASFVAWAADIPYFHYFGMRLNAFAVSRFNHPIYIIKLLFRNPVNLLSLGLCIAILFIYSYMMRRLRHRYLQKETQAISPNRHVTSNILFLFIFLLGFWGRIGVHPLLARTAYFCDYALPNQLGLNPVYTFTISIFEQYREKHNILRLMNDENAIRNVKKFLSIHQRPVLNSPIARKVIADNTHPPLRANVFIVLMESMSADFLSRYGNENHLTPNLDSLANKGWSFDNFYSSGMHTYQGIFSTLFGLPCILRNHPMLDEDIMSYSGFPNTLHAAGYQTAYFATHEGFRDNVNEFLPANSFDHFYSQEDYPDSEVQGLYGVSDDYLFHYAVGKCHDMHQNGKPFFATLMTGVNHPPYEMPKNIPFVATAEEEQDQFVQYADWAVGEFMKDAAQQTWFDSTIFIFVADHGAAIDKTYDLSLSYHHIPCIFYAPKILGQPRVIEQVGGQIDLFATTMGILNLPYTNNTLGVDLMKQPRKFAYFSEDDKIGCIGQDYLYVLRNNEVETLYHYRDKDLKNYLEEKQSLADSMSTYLKSMLQTTMWMIKNKKVGNANGE